MAYFRRASFDDVLRAVGKPTVNESQSLAAQAEAQEKQRLIEEKINAERERKKKEASKQWHAANWARHKESQRKKWVR